MINIVPVKGESDRVREIGRAISRNLDRGFFVARFDTGCLALIASADGEVGRRYKFVHLKTGDAYPSANISSGTHTAESLTGTLKTGGWNVVEATIQFETK